MPAAPLPKNETERLHALAACRVLDTPAEAAFDELTTLAAKVAGTPVGLVSLVDESRQWFKSAVGLGVSETPRKHAFCAHAILSPEPLIISDATQDPRTLDSPLVTGPPGIRFYAGFPLTLCDEFAVGTLCVIGFEPREIGAEALDTLRILARQVETQLELRRQLHRAELAEHRARSSSEAKTHFLANMNHEIRTPLTAILGFTDILLDDDANEDPELRRTSLSTIRQNGEHLLRIVNDVLDLSKIERGKLTIEALRCDPGAIAESVTSILGTSAKSKGIDLTYEAEADTPSVIESDPTRIRQILINLVGNAIKFTSEGQVSVRLSRDPDDATQIRFTVTDSGIGLSPEHLEIVRKFQPFVQADPEVSRKFGGSGLGLRISKSLARALGGDLMADSELGVGSVFSVSVATNCASKPEEGSSQVEPAAEAIEKAKPAASTKESQASSKKPLDGMRVLVAEDGPDNQKIIRMFLEKAGAELLLTENGQEAVEAFEADPDGFNLILLDMQMPVMDGYQAAARLRELGWSGTIFAITANAMEADRARSLEAGCDDLLAKPINRKALIARCAEAAQPVAG